MPEVLRISLQQVAQTTLHTWPFLALGIAVAAALKLLVTPERLAVLFRRRRAGSIVIATGTAVATPFCSCGTMAVILGMLASAVPWAPVVAFMVASPLTSPQELVFSAGLFGWPFALAFFGASIALGLAGGAAAHVLEASGWLRGQARYVAPPAPDVAGPDPVPPRGRALARAFAVEAWAGARKLVPLFLAFAFIGYFVNNLLPSAWIPALFGRGRWGVPLAATLGLPLYLNTEASLPLVRSFIDHGGTAGAALAFLVTGAGTSVGAIAGAFAIARWRVIGLVVATLWVGALVAGYTYDAFGGTVTMAAPPAAADGGVAAVQRDVAVLAGPEAAGRLSGTAGAARAADHLAEALRAAGLEPAGADGWFQPLDVPAARLAHAPRLRAGGRDARHRIDWAEIASVSGPGALTAPLAVVDGEQAPADAIAGHAVLLREPPPGFDAAGTAATVADLGGVALLVGSAGDGAFPKSVHGGAGRIPVLRVGASLARDLAARPGEPVSLDLPLEVAARPCRNVVGVLRGARRGPALLLSAHYDHVGDDPGGARFPGAFDNASGVAAVLEAARRLAAGPRLPFDVVVAFTTGEESGLWGARHLAAHPPAPLAAAITLDGVGAGPALAALRLGQAAPGDALGAMAAAVLREHGIEPRWIPGTDDSAAFREGGVPAVGLGEQPAGTTVLPLHTTGDVPERLEVSAIARATDVLVALVHGLADRGLLTNTDETLHGGPAMKTTGALFTIVKRLTGLPATGGGCCGATTAAPATATAAPAEGCCGGAPANATDGCCAAPPAGCGCRSPEER